MPPPEITLEARDSSHAAGVKNKMWPYCKNKHFDEGPAKCPICGDPSTGYFKNGELAMARVCPDCREKERKFNMVKRTSDGHKAG